MHTHFTQLYPVLIPGTPCGILLLGMLLAGANPSFPRGEIIWELTAPFCHTSPVSTVVPADIFTISSNASSKFSYLKMQFKINGVLWRG